MGWDTISDYMNSFIGAFFLFIGIILIPEIRKRKKYWIPIVVLIIILLGLGIDKINRDKRRDKLFRTERENDAKKIDSLLNDIKTMADNRKKDSTANAEFKASLETKFNIIQDSKTGEPVPKTFNTHIDKAGTVNIGR